LKRLHVNLAVADLPASVRFYTGLFGAPPTVLKPDYAKWMLDEAVADRGKRPGLDHLGIQAESREELAEVYGRLKAAKGPVLDQGDVTCCYARSEKSWGHDPQGVAWEAFLTYGESTVYGDDSGETAVAEATDRAASCCATSPATAASSGAGFCTPATSAA
jgi:catechol 2,3-dioxygenase-like lactoylglutathione lyase family enzyme